MKSTNRRCRAWPGFLIIASICLLTAACGGEATPEIVAGVDGCEECKREYEQMVRMRMALSALPDLVPPADEWKKIRTRVGADVSRIGGQLPALNAAW